MYVGGTGKFIELDESKLKGKMKILQVEGQCVFGGIERETGRCFLVGTGRET